MQNQIQIFFFNRTLKLHNRNRWLIPSKKDGYSFIHDDYNLIQEYNFKEEKSGEKF